MNRRFAITIALLVAATGCRPKAKPVEPSTTQAERAQTAAQTAAQVNADAGQEPAADAGAAAAANECTIDSHCTGYHRCENGACVVPPAVEGRIVEGMPEATFTKAGKEIASFYLEIADDAPERTRGLMFRRKMHPDFGMLFIFDRDEERSFWMKNTLIPLDMVHIDSKGTVVGVVERAAPMTLSPRTTGVPARYVLELTSGRAAEVGIVAGVEMQLSGLPPEQSPTP